MGNMSLDKIFNIAGAIVTMGTIAVIVGSKQTSGIINAITKGFTDSIRVAATGGARG